MSIFFNKFKSAFGFLVRGELFLFFGMFAVHLLPHRFFGMKKLRLFSAVARDEKQTRNSDGDFLLALEGPDATAELGSCYEFQDIEEALAAFRSLDPKNVELWCARDARLPDHPVVGAAWLFRRHYIVPFDGYNRFSICLDLLKDDRALLGTVYVPTKYRRRGLFSRLVDAMVKNDPNLHLLSSISAQNFVSIAAHEKIGFRGVGAIYHVRIGRRLWCYFRLPGIAQRWRTIQEGKRPVIEVDTDPWLVTSGR